MALHGPSIFAVRAKIYGVLYKQSSSIAFDETSSYWSALKSPNFSAFHWLPHDSSLVSIGQNFVTTRVVHLPKRTETNLITESDQSEPIINGYCIYARPTEPGPNQTRLCGPCIAALVGSHIITTGQTPIRKCQKLKMYGIFCAVKLKKRDPTDVRFKTQKVSK